MIDPQNKAFEDETELQRWIEKEGVTPKKASLVAKQLFEQGFDCPATLIDISSESLQRIGISVPVSQALSNNLKRRGRDKSDSFKTPTSKRVKKSNEGSIHHENDATQKSVEDLVQHCQEAMKDKERQHSFELVGLINDQVIERNDTLEEVKNFVCELLRSSVSPIGANDKQNFAIACTVCGSGGGKSTLCGLIEQKWTDDIKDAINKQVQELGNGMKPVTKITTAFATFNSTCHYDIGEARRLRPEASLGIRLVASRYGWSHQAISEFLSDIQATRGYSHISLEESLWKLLPEAEDEAVIILVDEILNLKDINLIRDILLLLSNFQHKCLRKSLKLFVLVSSLTAKPPVELTRKRQRQVKPISLPPISPLEVLKQAKLFAEKLITERDDVQEDMRHHLISEFCASGGLLKDMTRVIRYYGDRSNRRENYALARKSGDFTWASKVLSHSVFQLPLLSDDMSGTQSIEDLVFDHQISVVKNVLDNYDCQGLLVRIPTKILRSIGVYEGKSDLNTQQRIHLATLMSALATNRQSDRSNAKPFEIAVMRALCLRLSLRSDAVPIDSIGITLSQILPGCICADTRLLELALAPSNCDWVEVEKLTKEEVRKKRRHGTMVYSKLSNEGAVEGFWYLVINERPFILFLQMKFWKYCSPKEIARWEEIIHKRASDFELKLEDYVPLFFSTSGTFRVSSSLAMSKKATEMLLEPFGICPMMLYAEERYKKLQT